MSESSIVPPNVIEHVAWYRYADRNQEPLPAFVIGRAKGSKLSLFVLNTPANDRPQAITGFRLDSVRFIDDPELRANKEWQKQHGGWDYVLHTDPAVIAHLTEGQKRTMRAREQSIAKAAERKAQADKAAKSAS